MYLSTLSNMLKRLGRRCHGQFHAYLSSHFRQKLQGKVGVDKFFRETCLIVSNPQQNLTAVNYRRLLRGMGVDVAPRVEPRG